MNRHENGEIVCGAPGSIARELSETRDALVGALRLLNEAARAMEDTLHEDTLHPDSDAVERSRALVEKIDRAFATHETKCKVPV